MDILNMVQRTQAMVQNVATYNQVENTQVDKELGRNWRDSFSVDN